MIKNQLRQLLFIIAAAILVSCESPFYGKIVGVAGVIDPSLSGDWLTHEHILVDAGGTADINAARWDNDLVIRKMLPYLLKIESLGVRTFVDATPNYRGRDVRLLYELSTRSNVRIITNTGLYGALDHRFLPDYAFTETAEQLAARWIGEFKDGIEGTNIRPGFIKTSVNPRIPMDEIDRKLVIAAGLAHKKTGLTIVSNTGPYAVAYQEFLLLDSLGVAAPAFIWVHAEIEKDNRTYEDAAALGIWISLDGIASNYAENLEKLIYARKVGILDHILISHDGGYYDPDYPKAAVEPFDTISKKLIPDLKRNGFSVVDIHMLLHANPVKAFTIRRRLK